MIETSAQTAETKKNEDQQKETYLRTILLKQISEKHQSLVKSVQELPLFPQSYMDGLKKLDFGMLWLKEAISFAPIVFPRATPAATPAATNPVDNGAVFD